MGKDQSTTPGTSCPTLYDECVGSLTSPADHNSEDAGDGTYDLSSLSLSVGPVWGSNPRPPARYSDALPTELTGRWFPLLCHISIAKYYGMLRNISQFLPVPATLGFPLPALSSPASCPISPGLPPSCPTPYCTTFMIMDLIIFTPPLKVGFYQFLFSKLQHTHAKYFDLNCTCFKLFIHQSLNE